MARQVEKINMVHNLKTNESKEGTLAIYWHNDVDNLLETGDLVILHTGETRKQVGMALNKVEL